MKLTKELLLEAINKSIDNAGQLIEEGAILFANKRFPRAYALYQFAIEETGKASMTFSFLMSDDYKDESKHKTFFKDFRDHKAKTLRASGIDYIIAKSLDDKKELQKILITNMIKQNEDIEKINNNKNYSLYTSLIGERFFTPTEVISEKNADDLGFYAKFRFSATKQLLKMLIDNFDGLKQEAQKVDVEKLISEEAFFLTNLLYGTDDQRLL